MTFDDWKADFLKRSAFPHDLADHLTYLPAPQKADQSQTETRLTLRQYLEKTVTTARIETGQRKAQDYAQALADLQRRYGVPGSVLLAIWGMETNFGAVMGDVPVFAALASLAYDGRRRALFEDQLMAAAHMFRMRNNFKETLTGSWAGAMGHTQFMPRAYVDYAVGFDGGAADIWGNDPRDALASTANYLAQHGWTAALPWGIEAAYALPPLSQPATDIEAWITLGVQPKGTAPKGLLRFLLPAGHGNPAFLVTPNFDALLAYNKSDSYALAVCLLANRIAGGALLQSPWNGPQTALTQTEIKTLQRRLTALGHDTYGADGFMGPNTAKAIIAFQTAQGMVPDGFPSPELRDALKTEDI